MGLMSWRDTQIAYMVIDSEVSGVVAQSNNIWSMMSSFVGSLAPSIRMASTGALDTS